MSYLSFDVITLVVEIFLIFLKHRLKPKRLNQEFKEISSHFQEVSQDSRELLDIGLERKFSINCLLFLCE